MYLIHSESCLFQICALCNLEDLQVALVIYAEISGLHAFKHMPEYLMPDGGWVKEYICIAVVALPVRRL